MEIFLSWSGERSGHCARALKEWLPCIMQALDPWISSHDIAKGERGAIEIAKKLDEVDFGVVCLTSENVNSNWINFESGALSKRLSGSALFTFLLDLRASDVGPPLGQFQHTRADRADMLRLVEAINAKLPKSLPEALLRTSFEKFWPDLEAKLRSTPAAEKEVKTSRSDREVLEEILSHVRVKGRDSPPNFEREAALRKTTKLQSFAEGYISGRSETGTTFAFLSETGDLILGYTLYGTEYQVPIPHEGPWEEIKTLIVKNIDDNIIPF